MLDLVFFSNSHDFSRLIQRGIGVCFSVYCLGDDAENATGRLSGRGLVHRPRAPPLQAAFPAGCIMDLLRLLQTGGSRVSGGGMLLSHRASSWDGLYRRQN